jgi:hypothetical protein
VPEYRRPKFSAAQRQELLTLGLFPEQVTRLELNALPSISWRLRRPPRMEDVRACLTELVDALDHVERLYLRISTPKNKACAETATRLYQAQEALFEPANLDERDKLHDSLEAATSIVRRAFEDLPPKGTRRSTQRDSSQFVRLILWALQEGHGWHFVNQSKPMTAFTIEVARKKPPFPQIAEIVAEASGRWSADDAIKVYLRAPREKSETLEARLRYRKRH